MAILVVNAGSTSVKYKLFDETFQELLAGQVENKQGTFVSTLNKNSQKFEWSISQAEYDHSGQIILREIKDYQVDKIGFRVVHGGERFIRPAELTPEVIAGIEEVTSLAPLHNPPALDKIKEFRTIMPGIRQFAVFDTAFHATMEPKAFLYALPYQLYEKDHIRRYGFHGISHKYVSTVLQQLEPAAQKVISCHLGGGSSLCAIKSGKSVDTSMGFTPEEGLEMATRAGDVDDGVIQYLMQSLHYSLDDIQNLENKQSGLLGVSGTTSDMRTLLELEAKGDNRAHLAIEIYVYRVQKYIGAYAAALGGLDALIFTAGVGSGSDIIRQRIGTGLQHLKLEVAERLNIGRVNVSSNLKINALNSIPVWVIPTNEELQIAREINEIE